MTHTPEQIAAFRARLREGLAGVYTSTIPVRERRHQNRRMMVHSEKETETPIQNIIQSQQVHTQQSDLTQLKAQVNFLQNKVTELRAEKKRRDDGGVPF